MKCCIISLPVYSFALRLFIENSVFRSIILFACREKTDLQLPVMEGDMTTMSNDLMKEKLVKESLSY